MSARRAAVVYDCLFPATHGGGERVYGRLAELLVDRGYSVDYITRVMPEAVALAAAFPVVGVWDGELYDAQGVRTPTGALGFARGVYRHFRRTRGTYDVVLASALPVLTLLAVRLALRGDRATIVGDWLEVWSWRKWTSYSGRLSGTAAWALQWLGARATTLHTVNSAFTARALAGVRRSLRPRVLGLVDLVESPRGEGTALDTEPVVLFVGRLIADKRAHLVPAALAVARRTVPQLRAVIVGDGPEAPAVRAAIEAHGLRDEVRMLARVPDAELESLMRSSAVLLNTSQREGFGLVVVEAAAVGTPAIVVRGADNAAVDLVTPQNGIVAQHADPEELGAAIVEVIGRGAGLRQSTAAWFEGARKTRGLAASLDGLLADVPR